MSPSLFARVCKKKFSWQIYTNFSDTSVFRKILMSSRVTETNIGFKPRQFAGRRLHSSSSVLVAAGHQGKKERETEGLYNSEEG